MDQHCFSSIAAGAVVVTANQRLYRAIVDDYDAACLADGQRAWETADVLPWTPWLERMWREAPLEARGGQRLLSDMEEALIWEQIVAADPRADGLLQLANTAQAAREAAALLHAWEIEVDALTAGSNRDVHAFRAWQRSFTVDCEHNNWLTRGALCRRVAGLVERGKIQRPATLWLAGFAELAPQQTSLIAALRAAGSRVEDFPQPVCEPVPQRVAFADAHSEAVAVAKWLKQTLADEPRARIGVVVPQIGAMKTVLRNILDDTLAPGAILPQPTATALPYNMSLGDPLAHYPMIDTALRVLRVATGRLSLDEVGCLLRSPFLRAAEAEFAGRACLDAELHKQGRRELGLPALLAAIERSKFATANAGLQDLITRLRSAAQAWPRRSAPSGWAGHFAAFLNAAGWPGERALDAAEYQTLESWRTLLDRFASLDPVRPLLEAREAVGVIRRLAGKHIFQPRSPQVQVQVLGPLEAIGQRFDYLWIMNLHDEVWPESPRPTPFIPIRLQREKGIAHASPERELEYARAVLSRLLATAPKVVLSYPCNDIDRELRPSPLIRGYPESEPPVSDDAVNYTQQIQASRQLQWLHDAAAPSVAMDAQVRGGTSLLRDQALCPFRAFAHHRLNAKALEQPGNGLDASERGQLVHQALHFLWADLRDHARLVTLDEAACQERVARAVERAIDAFRRQRPDAFGARFTAMEQARLSRLLMQWLGVDRSRPPFTVTGVETKHAAVLDGMTLDTRIDRIDKLADGRIAIIDYKTGNPERVRIGNWFSERPEDPQLPLYAITTKGPLGAVLFARVSKGRCDYIGVSESDNVVVDVGAFETTREANDVGDWQALLNGWSEVINAIAQEYRRGDARVAPKRASVCDTCDLHSFCRIRDREATPA